MSADDAFDNLMNKNALPIPMAKPNTDVKPGCGPGGIDVRPGATGRRDRDGTEPEGSMRVSELLDDAPGDYRPMESEPDGEERTLYSHPTETDLSPADDDDEGLESARLRGARVMGRDADGEEAAIAGDGDGDGDDDAGYQDAQVYDGALDDQALDAGLGLARRVRRFAYLPLAGMDKFESDARDMMAHLTSLHPERPSLLVTSAARGAGRTELAMRLALAMAKRVGFRVLLADFDIRHPQAAARLGVSSKHFALSDVLRGSCPLGEALVASEEDNLYVLPARASDRDGDEIIDSRQARGLFEQVHAAFDFTVVDCGPVTNADAMILCRVVGATALAGYCGITTAREIAEAGDRLEAAGARLAGVLLTGA